MPKLELINNVDYILDAVEHMGRENAPGFQVAPNVPLAAMFARLELGVQCLGARVISRSYFSFNEEIHPDGEQPRLDSDGTLCLYALRQGFGLGVEVTADDADIDGRAAMRLIDPAMTACEEDTALKAYFDNRKKYTGALHAGTKTVFSVGGLTYEEEVLPPARVAFSAPGTRYYYSPERLPRLGSAAEAKLKFSY